MVKIDTKADFSIFQLEEADITENMADTLQKDFQKLRHKEPGNLILQLPEGQKIPFSLSFLKSIKQAQSDFLDQGLSFQLALVREKHLKKQLEEIEINFTPTVAEAIDIIMMEKLERDLLEGE